VSLCARSVHVPNRLLQEGWLSHSPMERASVSAISLRHILVFPVYAPGTIALNVTWMKRGFNACQTHRSMYPSIFNSFPVIQPVISKVRHFSTFFAHLCLPGYAPGTIAVNVTWIEREFNAGHGLSCGEESMTICSAVLIQYQRVTDRQTDGRTAYS